MVLVPRRKNIEFMRKLGLTIDDVKEILLQNLIPLKVFMTALKNLT